WFNGFISRFSAGRGGNLDTGSFRDYQAEVVPWLWFLTRTADCRTFSEKTVPQMIEKIFEKYSQKDFQAVAAKFKPWEYCVQYRETDFNFVSRMMEQEGIFYYFKHAKGSHQLVLGCDAGVYAPSIGELEHAYNNLNPADKIYDWVHQYQLTPGKY